jgi:hypothetical protein
MRIGKKHVLGVAVAVVVATAGAAVGNATDSSNVASSPQAESFVSSTARSDLAQFRHTRSKADVLPPVFNDSPLTSDAVPDSSRRIQVSGNRAAWVMAGDKANQLCFVVLGASTCDDASVLQSNGLLWSFSARPGEPARIEGVTVDGVSQVRATLSDGSTLSADVADNGFSIALPDGVVPESLDWSGDRGTGHVAVNIPSTLNR